jgi:hypothetical protein
MMDVEQCREMRDLRDPVLREEQEQARLAARGLMRKQMATASGWLLLCGIVAIIFFFLKTAPAASPPSKHTPVPHVPHVPQWTFNGSSTCTGAQQYSGCTVCSDSATCSACKDGMVLDKNICAPNSCGILGCASCGQDNKCTTCAPNYYGAGCTPWYKMQGPKLIQFYSYRAKNNESYPFTNVDGSAASAVIGYLHHEVVGNLDSSNHPVHKFGIDRIQRTLITMHNPPAVYEARNGQFGQWDSFDKGRCDPSDPNDKPGCPLRFQTYGYAVGCLKNPFCVTCDPTSYYDFPGPCPIADYTQQNDTCKAQYPGGQCIRPDGRRECTWNETDAGFILLDDLEGVNDTEWKTWSNFSAHKACEFDKFPGACATRGLIGSGLPFWDHMDYPPNQRNRTTKLIQMFQEKYPERPILPEPSCDW